MRPEDLHEQLEHLSLPHVEIKSHKRELRFKLLESQFRNPTSLISHPMSFLKKLSPLAGILVLLFLIIFITWQPHSSSTTYAKELVNEALVRIQDDQNPDTVLKRNILQSALKSPDLQYAGEEQNSQSKNLKKISFTDEKSKENVVIYIDPTVKTADGIILPEYIKNSNGVYFNGEKIDQADPNNIQALHDGYLKDAHDVYFLNQRVEGADLASFTVLSGTFAKDQHAVYAQGKKIEGVDPSSFEILHGDGGYSKEVSYGKDKNGIYLADGQEIKGADLASFQVLIFRYSKDKNHVYFYDQILPGRDAESFEVISKIGALDQKNGSYTKDKHGIYYQNEKITNVDMSTFQVLSSSYAKDKNRRYCYGTKIKDADTASFEALDYGFGKDKNHVYVCEQILPEADPFTFQQLNDNYAKDQTHVYWQSQILKSEVTGTVAFPDVGSFEVFDTHNFVDYAKDKDHVYWAGNLIQDADPQTFSILSHDFEEYQKSVYFPKGAREQLGSPLSSFHFMGSGYAKDKNTLFYFTEKFEGADFATFEDLGDGFGKDKNHVYRGNQVIQGADPQTFQYLGNFYGKDKNHVYYVDFAIPMADVQSFQILKDTPYGFDKNNFYLNGDRLKGQE